MVKARYGDIIILNFDPSSGMEIQKRRPAVVVSNDTFNMATNIRLVCPITHTDRLFAIQVPDGLPVEGYVLTQQVKAADVSSRSGKVVGKMDEATMLTISNLLKLFF